MAITSFRCKETQRLFERVSSRRFKLIESTARRKLELLHAASTLNFLKIPPGNRLEALKGDRVGQYSIRVNAQFRICFRWNGIDAEDVEIVDYH
jgi:proteic killer suppression protein